jgi:hypothetical protein
MVVSEVSRGRFIRVVLRLKGAKVVTRAGQTNVWKNRSELSADHAGHLAMRHAQAHERSEDDSVGSPSPSQRVSALIARGYSHNAVASARDE